MIININLSILTFESEGAPVITSPVMIVEILIWDRGTSSYFAEAIFVAISFSVTIPTNSFVFEDMAGNL